MKKRGGEGGACVLSEDLYPGKVTNYAAKHTACIVKRGWKKEKDPPANRKIEIQDEYVTFF